MRLIPLSKRGWKNRGKYNAVVDDVDYLYLSRFNWVALVQGNAPNVRVYAVRNVGTPDGIRSDRMHRVVWERRVGPLTKAQEIDHIEPGELGGLDNRLGNLRIADKAMNQANERIASNNTSGYKGVWWQKQYGKWRADLIVGGKKKHLGYFEDKEVAAKAYDTAALQAFGEFARLNFPEAANG